MGGGHDASRGPRVKLLGQGSGLGAQWETGQEAEGWGRWLRLAAGLGLSRLFVQIWKVFLSPFESRRPWPKRSAFQILQAGRAVPAPPGLLPPPLLPRPVADLSTLPTSWTRASPQAGSPAPTSAALQHQEKGPWAHDRRKHLFPLPIHHLLSFSKGPS